MTSKGNRSVIASDTTTVSTHQLQEPRPPFYTHQTSHRSTALDACGRLEARASQRRAVDGEGNRGREMTLRMSRNISARFGTTLGMYSRMKPALASARFIPSKCDERSLTRGNSPVTGNMEGYLLWENYSEILERSILLISDLMGVILLATLKHFICLLWRETVQRNSKSWYWILYYETRCKRLKTTWLFLKGTGKK